MRRIVIPGTDLTVSRFIFGTASLFNVRYQDRQRLLDAAYDSGFSHFDTAPLYGFGWAERELSPFLKRHPDATVTTKVGIYSPGGEHQAQAMVFARKVGGKGIPALSRPTSDWSIARARHALDGSLRRLGRDCIDLYTLHEPDFAGIDPDAWLRWLEQERADGRVRRFGIAVEAQRLGDFIAAASPLADIVQTIDSLDNCEADTLIRAGRPLQITYGYVSAAKGAPVEETLTRALARNAQGAIIVSTRREERIGQYRRLLERSETVAQSA